MSSRPTDQRVVVILGMHRSGTSALAGCLQQEGLFLGEVITEAQFNPKGNREPRMILLMQEDLLAANGGAWDCPPKRVVWTDEHRAIRDAFIAGFVGREVWGFKDPRTLLTLEGWQEVLEMPKYLGIFRHPLAVGRSICSRRRLEAGKPEISLERSVELWLHYNRRLYSLRQRCSFPLLCFDKEPECFLCDVRRAAVLLGIGGGPGGDAFFEPTLRSQSATGWGEIRLPAQLHEEASTLYDRLMELAM